MVTVQLVPQLLMLGHVHMRKLSIKCLKIHANH